VIVSHEYLLLVFVSASVVCAIMANLTLRYLDELSYVLNSRKHLATQTKASSVGDLLNAEEDRFAPVSILVFTKILHCQHYYFDVLDNVKGTPSYNGG
jgi:hypothetical protein